MKKILHQEGAPNDYILVKFDTEKKPVFHVAQIMVVYEVPCFVYEKNYWQN